MDSLVLGIDPGNFKCKVVGPLGSDIFRSNICEWFERDIKETFDGDDMEFVIGKRRGFAGTIALYEDEFGNGSIYGDSKAHDDTKVRVLLAINRYLDKYCPNVTRISIVVGQPIKKHKEEEKEKIRGMLLGQHVIKVNGKTRIFVIENVGVAPEGSAAFWGRPEMGKVHVIDIGSGTVNAATIIDNRHINNASSTFNFGMETINDKDDLENVARGIIRNTTKLKWSKEDKIYICGGAAAAIAPYITLEYKNAILLMPKTIIGNEVKMYDPVFSNAVGFYTLARGAFE